MTKLLSLFAAPLFALILPALGQSLSIDNISDLQTRIEARPSDENALRVLLDAVRNPDQNVIVRVNALAALGDVASVVPNEERARIRAATLSECHGSVPEMQRQAYLALLKFAAPTDVPANVLSEGLRDESSDVAAFAAELVEKTKVYDADIVSKLVSIVRAGTERRSLATIPAVVALGTVTGPNASVESVLTDALQAHDPEVAVEAAVTLAHLSVTSSVLVSALESLMKQPRYYIRVRVLDAVAELIPQSHAPSLITIVEEGISDENPAVRERARIVVSTNGLHLGERLPAK